MHPCAGQLRVCFVGDSFVQGIGDPAGMGWTGRVVRGALERAVPLTAFNLGIRRQTSLDIARRWENECAERLLPQTVNHLLFSFGTNDTVVEQGRRRVPEADTLAATRAMLDRAGELGFACAFVGPPPALDDDGSVAGLAARLSEICADEAVPCLNLFTAIDDPRAWLDEVARGDGAHPGAAGYTLIAHLVETWPGWWFGPSYRAPDTAPPGGAREPPGEGPRA